MQILVANVDESVQVKRENTVWQLFKSLFTIPKNLRALSLAMTLQASVRFFILTFSDFQIKLSTVERSTLSYRIADSG